MTEKKAEKESVIPAHATENRRDLFGWCQGESETWEFQLDLLSNVLELHNSGSNLRVFNEQRSIPDLYGLV